MLLKLTQKSDIYKLSGQNVDEFPKTPTVSSSSSSSINSTKFVNAINKTLFACEMTNSDP